MRLGEHHDVHLAFLTLDDLLLEGLLLLLVVEAPHVREEDAKLERGRSLLMCERLIWLRIMYLLSVVIQSLGGPLGVPHVLARLLNDLLSNDRSL